VAEEARIQVSRKQLRAWARRLAQADLILAVEIVNEELARRGGAGAEGGGHAK